MISDKPVAVLDACVLAGTMRRLVLMALADEGLFKPIFSHRILEEARHAIPKTYKNSAFSEAEKLERAERVIAELLKRFPTGLVSSSQTFAVFNLPDPDDVHVAETAFCASAQYIVTENLKDFPKKRLKPHNIEPISTDAFAVSCLSGNKDCLPLINDRLKRAFVSEFADEIHVQERLKKVGLKKVATLLV